MTRIIKTARGRITTEHGEDAGRARPHVGIDIGNGNMGPDDLRMVAPAAGKVTHAGWPKGSTYGNHVIIVHADGTWSLIAHMASLAVSVGDTVTQGQLIGVMGRTGGPWGNAGWYVHGHQEYHLANGAPTNPLDYMGSAPAGNITPITSGDDDMATLELVKTATDDKTYYSVNRLQRYHVDGPTTLKDYQFFITEQKNAGNPHAKPDVQIVKNLSAFGAIVK